jgi:hypothetical protein
MSFQTNTPREFAQCEPGFFRGKPAQEKDRNEHIMFSSSAAPITKKMVTAEDEEVSCLRARILKRRLSVPALTDLDDVAEHDSLVTQLQCVLDLVTSEEQPASPPASRFKKAQILFCRLENVSQPYLKRVHSLTHFL